MKHSLRTALALAAAAALLTGTGVATAAPAVSCNLLADAKGDDGSAVFQHSESLDLVGGDIASSAKTVTAVIRVAKFTKSDTAAAPTGRAWYLEFSIPGGATPLWLGAQITPSGEIFRYGWVDGTIRRSLGTALGVFDEAKSEIRISSAVGIWAERGSVKPGAKLTGITAASYNFVGAAAVGGSLQPGDTAETTNTYTAGAPSCVKVGK